ncbi:hypothetical protein BS78_03G279500 [Paspalum vaginatum]|nr:hypothetical protein BS78_03G279500 [Paspalum vaginatum]
MAARAGIVLCLSVLIVGAALAATAAEALTVPPPPGFAAPAIDVAGAAGLGTGGGRGRGGIRRGRWNRDVQADDARKREVPGGPDPQHHD